MATSFPSGLDSLTNPSSGDSLSSPSHSAQHANVNDAVEALQAKVGVDGSAVTTSLDYKVAHQGLVLIASATFANPDTSVSFDNVFTSAYRNYRVVWNVSASQSSTTLDMRFRSSGSDNTTTGYVWLMAADYMSGGSYGSSSTGGQAVTSMSVGYKYNAYYSGGTIDIFTPQLAEDTGLLDFSIMVGTTLDRTNGGACFVNTTQFDGFTLYSPSGWMTGKVSVYGYNA